MLELDKYTSMVYDKCNDCIDNFNFQKVFNIMQFLHWEWEGVGLPDVNKLKAEARKQLMRCLQEAYHNGEFQLSSGGLFYYAWVDKDKGLQAKIAFEAVNYRTD